MIITNLQTQGAQFVELLPSPDDEQPRPQAFPLKNGWGGKRRWHRLVTCLLVHPKILGVIN